jgi:hypothetical protein
MKQYLTLIIIAVSLTLSSCGGGGGGGDNPPDPQPTNNAPNQPSITTPTNNQLCIDNVVTFQWNAATDPDGDTVKYQLQTATDNQFTQNVQTQSNITNTSVQITLDKGVAYYWRVKAIDSKNASSDYSSTFQFYTEGEGESNHLPFSPSVVAPSLNEVVQTASATLEWTANDVDNDPLTFDVYFGTENPPVLISENLSALTFDVDLTSSTDYFWRIVVKDDKGGVTIGQVWSFKTD